MGTSGFALYLIVVLGFASVLVPASMQQTFVVLMVCVFVAMLLHGVTEIATGRTKRRAMTEGRLR